MPRCRPLLLLLILGISFSRGNAQQTPSAEQPIENPDWTQLSRPVLINHVEAEFPVKARLAGMNGICVVSIVVDTQGLLQNVKVINCTDPIFAENSLKAVSAYRFKPAMNKAGNPVSVKLAVEIDFRLNDKPTIPNNVSYILKSPPNVTTSEPDSNGVYPLTDAIELPRLTAFPEPSFSRAAFFLKDLPSCDLEFTIDSKGKVVDPHILQCDKKVLEEPAVTSLLKAHFKPGKAQGKAVAVRAAIHLSYAGNSAKP